MKQLDFKTACIIAGYQYRIIDKSGREYDINSVDEDCFVVEHEDGKLYAHYFEKIGVDYWILARPLEDLSKECQLNNYKGVPDQYLGKTISHSLCIYKPISGDIEFSIETPNYSTEIDLYDGVRILEFLLENHFAIGLEAEWWKPIKE